MSDHKTVLITGASKGIGYLTAKALAEQGMYVYASMRDVQGRNASAASGLKAWAEEKGLAIEPIELDVTSSDSVDRAIREIEQQRPLSVLVNNAGVMPTGLTEAYTTEQVERFFDVNMFGIVRTCRAVLPFMRQRKSGLLINISSSAGRFSIPFFGVYCASKWAMEAYCESLHFELEPFGIQSVLIEPSGHGTDLVKTAPAPKDAACAESYGDLAKGRDRLLGMFQSMFDENDPATDANNIAEKIVGLVNMDGPLPMRTQVGHDMGVEGLNAATAPFQQTLIDQLRPVYLPEAAK